MEYQCAVALWFSGLFVRSCYSTYPDQSRERPWRPKSSNDHRRCWSGAARDRWLAVYSAAQDQSSTTCIQPWGTVMLNRMLSAVGKLLAGYLSQPSRRYMPLSTSDPIRLAMVLRPADVLLVEGNTRFSTAIKYLTQS